MTKQHIKNIALTFLISNIWFVYVFFDYYSENGLLKGLTLWFDFFSAAIFAIGLAIINLGLRFTIFRNQSKILFKNNFFYIFSAYSNFIIVVVYCVYLIKAHSIREFFSSIENTTIIILLNFILAVIVGLDLYIKNQSVEKPATNST